MSDVTLGIIFGFLAMIGFGIGNGMSQVPVRRLGAVRTIFVRNIFICTFLLIVLFFFLRDTSFSWLYLLITFGITLAGYLGLATFYKAVEFGKMGVVAPITNSQVIVTVVLSLLIFSDKLTGWQGLFIALIVIGVILISSNIRDFKNSNLFKLSSGIPYALMACLLWGIMWALFRMPVVILGAIFTSFLIELGVLMFGGVHLKIRNGSFKMPDKKMLVYIIVMALFGAAGTLFYVLGIMTYKVSIIAAIVSASTLVQALYGRFVYKEKMSIIQWLAVLIILTGLAGVSYF